MSAVGHREDGSREHTTGVVFRHPWDRLRKSYTFTRAKLKTGEPPAGNGRVPLGMLREHERLHTI